MAICVCLPNQEKVERSLIALKRLFPALRDLTVTESWAGYIDATPDAVPVIANGPEPPIVGPGSAGAAIVTVGDALPAGV